MAFVTMLMVPAAPTGYMYGAIVDALKDAARGGIRVPDQLRRVR